MKFEIGRASFEEMLNMALKAVAKKTTNPVLSGVKIELKEGALHIYATDLQTGFHGELDVTSYEGEGAFIVEAKLLSDIVKKLAELTLQMEVENSKLIIKSGASKFALATMDPEEFPEIEPNVTGTTIEFDKEELQNMLEKVVFCALKESEQYSRNLSSVYWDFRENGYLSLVAADGFRLGLAEMKLDILEVPPSFLLALKSVEELINVMDNAITEKISMTFDGSRVGFVFEKDNVELVLNVIDAKYPNYIDIIPKAFKTKMILSKDLFLDAIDRVAIAAKKTEQLKMEIEGNTLRLIASSPEVGEAVEELEMEKDGEDIVIGFSPKFLRESIKEIDTAEIEFNISGEESPTQIKPLGDDSYMYIVMPVRLV